MEADAVWRDFRRVLGLDSLPIVKFLVIEWLLTIFVILKSQKRLQFLAHFDIFNIYKKQTRCLVVCSEGSYFSKKVNAYLVSRGRKEDFNEQKTFR